MNPIQHAIQIAGGPTAFTRKLNARIRRKRPITYQAIRKWASTGSLPRTEWTGETDYASAIEDLTGGEVSRVTLLERASREAA